MIVRLFNYKVEVDDGINKESWELKNGYKYFYNGTLSGIARVNIEVNSKVVLTIDSNNLCVFDFRN